MVTNGQPSIEQQGTTKILAAFFPLRVLKNKFNESYLNYQISEFVPKLKQFTNKVIMYRVDNEKFYPFDYEKNKFNENNIEVYNNKTIIMIFSVDKTANIDVQSLIAPEIAPYVNIVRLHRKKVEAQETDSTYLFYTINATNLLNKILDEETVSFNVKSLKKSGNNTFFIMSASNAKRNEADSTKPIIKEKVCPANYLGTALFEKVTDEKSIKNLVKKRIADVPPPRRTGVYKA